MKKISAIIFCYVLFVFNGNIYAQTNYALDFDGGDDYISTGYLPLANNSFTIEFWAKQDAAALGRYRIAVSQGTGVSNQGLHIGFRDNNYFTFAFYGDDLDYTTAFTNTDWHHWACTYDASTNTRKIYLDGKLVASDNPASDYTGGDKLYIGYNVVSGNNYWDGQIDEVRVWGEARKHSDVLSTMHIQLTGSESYLLANWRFDDGFGSIVTDLKTTYNGTLQNMTDDDWLTSTIPFGSGTNETQTGLSTGSWITFSGTGVRMYFNTLPAGEIVSVTKISGAPNVVPSDLDDVFDSQYWIINRSSADAIDANIEFSVAEDLTSEDNNYRHWIRLYDRAFNSDGAWSYLKDAAWVDGTNNYAAFDNISTFQQFIYGRLYDLFTENSSSLTGVYYSDADWGDYDNDGDLDILLTGYDGSPTISKIYKNNGNESFTDINAGLTGVYWGSADWGDYDNDGDLDILLTGHGISKIYKNNGNDSFSDINAGLTGVYEGSSADWGDYDNDGDLDILLTGDDGSNKISKIYRNNGSDSFTDIGARLTGVQDGSVAWGDYDNDGDLDILLIGYDGSSYISKIYQNNGNDSFSDINAGLTEVGWGSAAWGDYDNDGDLDILLTGYTGSVRISKIYKNNGNDSFSDINAGITGVAGPAAWGDYNSDGNLDVLLSGTVDGSPVRISRIYKNNGNDSFTDINAGLTSVMAGCSAWGDYDNDGDLDILLTGDTGSEQISKIYRNNSTVSNSVPNTPTNLSSSISGDEVTLSWDAATDNETASAGLNYNIRIGTTPEGSDLLGPMANTSTGFRRIAKIGRVNNNRSITINTESFVGLCYWSVQAIDGSFAGGAFAAEATFEVEGFVDQTSISLTSVSDGSVSWGDYDNDGDLDILLTGSGISKIYKNNGNDSFSDISAGLTGVSASSVAWGDYDNNGYLDILLTGSGISKIYKNNGNYSFSDINAGLTGVSQGSVAWGDYDNDGDLDILLTGSGISKIYQNNGNDSFSDINAGLTGVTNSSAAWGDYDNDGDLDILLTGDNGPNKISKIYRNNGSDSFTDIGAGLPGVSKCSATWGDYDNDGDLDILLTGELDLGFISYIYENRGNGSFYNIYAGLTGIWTGGSTAWGDYDNDGDLDIILTGQGYSVISKIYQNDGNDSFSDIGAGLPGVTNSSVAWGDYDNDGDLDLLLSGDTGSGNVTKIYKNYRYTSNTIPSAPTNLSSSVNGDDVTFSWDAATDTETPSNGLKYKLCIGSSSGALDLLSPMSNTSNGFNRNPSVGDLIDGNSITIKDLPQNSDIYWSVQTIDAGMKGSVFATEQGAHPLPVELTSFVALFVENKVNLNWQTATEVNNFGFNVELRIENGEPALSGVEEWETRGFVQGNGTTNSPKEYSFTDSELPNVDKVSYRLKQIDNDGAFAYSKVVTVDLTNITSVDDEVNYTFALEQNYPNPFNPSTTINFTVPSNVKRETQDVKLVIYDILGREETTLVNQKLQPGNHEVNFDASKLSSGIYFYRINIGEDYNSIKKMLLVK